MSFNIEALPDPAVLYKIIYDYVKGQLVQSASLGDPYYLSLQQGQSSSEGSLTFTDD